MYESSILAKVDSLIHEALGLKSGSLNYGHKTTCLELSGVAQPSFDAAALIENILAQVKENWHGQRSRSDNQNWRWTKNVKIDRKNSSPEVALERWIVRTTGEDWVNQVPVASGLADSAGGRRAIDLVHRCGDGWYEFIELKADERGGTPLFAAMEILQYGVLYMFSRDNAQPLGYAEKRNELLRAAGIHLKILAPAAYYDEYNLSWLENSINEGLGSFMARRNAGYRMDFSFEVLSLIPSLAPVSWGRGRHPRSGKPGRATRASDKRG